MNGLMKWLLHDPARTKELGKRVGVAVAAFLLVWIGWNIGRGQAPTQEATAGQTAGQEVGSLMAPGPGQPSASPTTIPDDPVVPITGSADAVTKAFLNAYYTAPAFEQSKRGQAMWAKTVLPYATGQAKGLLTIGGQAPPKVRTDKAGKPIKVVSLTSLGQIGDTAEVQAAMTDGSYVRVTVSAVGDGWAVSAVGKL